MTSSPSETLYLIDGYASIFRAYFAIRRPLYSPATGEPTQGVLVFAQMLLKLFTELRPDYVAVALDAPGPTFRDALYSLYDAPESVNEVTPLTAPAAGEASSTPEGNTAPAAPAAPAGSRTGLGYKGHRPETPGDLDRQVPRILEMLGLCGVPVISRPGLEADDVIATLADRLTADPAHPNLRVRIVSRDKDLEQLLSDRVTLFDVHTEAEMDVAALREKRGVTPAQVPDLLALTGDPVDNVPGVEGIGPKTAARLLQEYGTLDALLENLPQVKERWRVSLERARPTLPVSRRLVTLERDPDLTFDLESARVRPLPADALCPFFDQLGFARLAARFAAPTGTAETAE